MYKYLFKLNNKYNNQNQAYEIQPLRGSTLSRVVIFAGHENTILSIKNHPSIFVYLEMDQKLDELNKYSSLQRLLNLIYLETTVSTHYQQIDINNISSFGEIFKIYKSPLFYNPQVSFHGHAPIPNHIHSVQYLVDLINKLNEDSFEKFDNALNTFIWAQEIREMYDPHLKYTLYMTLFLSSMEQLAEDPQYCENEMMCNICEREHIKHHIKGQSTKKSIEKLMRELITGPGLEEGVKRVNKLYTELRSKFLHIGNLYGDEKNGGFLGGIKSYTEIIEDEVNIIEINKRLLELFIQSKAQK